MGLKGRIAFGYGLGDIINIFILWSSTFIYIIVFFINRNKLLRLFATNIIFSIFSIWIILQSTIWRGSEYKWNGDFFYIPCRTEITVTENKRHKDVVLSMCSMEYHSQFSGIWNSKEVELTSGEIEIPEKLHKYIKFPIHNVLIVPYHFHQIIDNETIHEPQFNKEELRINETYTFSGEIIQIKDKVPVIRVKLNKK